MLVNTKCPQCGASLSIDDTREVFYCDYCGHKIVNVHEKIDVHHSGSITLKQDRSGDPNLFISYASTDPSVNMVSKIAFTNQTNNYVNGSSSTFHLTAGFHTIILKIGKRNYERKIYIREDFAPVRISAGYNGKAFINIDQPPYQVANTPISNRSITTKSTTPGKKTSVLSIIALIAAGTLLFTPVGIGLAIRSLAYRCVAYILQSPYKDIAEITINKAVFDPSNRVRIAILKVCANGYVPKDISDNLVKLLCKDANFSIRERAASME